MERDREAFEAHIRSLLPYAKFDRDEDGSYIAVMLNARWMGWQAALAYVRENGEGAESRADAFFDRALSTPEAQAALQRGDEKRPKAKLTLGQKLERAARRNEARMAAEKAAARRKTGLTPAQRETLGRLAEGDSIAYSQDGDIGWFTKNHDRLVIGDGELHELRLRGFIGAEPDFEDDTRCGPNDVITDAGRRALAENAEEG